MWLPTPGHSTGGRRPSITRWWRACVAHASVGGEAGPCAVHDATIRRFFDTQLDRNGDGVATAEEILAYARVPGMDEMDGHADIASAIRTVDGNGDGIVAWAEFADAFARLDPARRYREGVVRALTGRGGRGRDEAGRWTLEAERHNERKG